MLTGNTRTTTTGAGPQVALVAQTADRVAVARVATCRAVDFVLILLLAMLIILENKMVTTTLLPVDVPVARHALLAQVADHVLSTRALPVRLSTIPANGTRPMALAGKTS